MKKAILMFALAVLSADVCHARFADKPIYKSRLTCPGSIALGDLNGDGKTDMLINTFGKGWSVKESKLLLYYNKDGVFPQNPDKVIELPGCYSMAIYDFDKNGKNDIGAVIGRDIVFLLNKDDFDPGKKLNFFNTNQSNGHLQVCKINSKGAFDVLRGPVWRKFFLKDGKFSVRNGYILGPEINDTWNTLAVDVNSDDIIDIVGTGRKDNTLRIYYGPLLNVTVNPEELGEFLQLKVIGYLGSFAVADLNSDGLQDLIVSDTKNNKTHIYLQNQPIGFDQDAEPSITVNAGGQVFTEDLNGDKLSDLIILFGYDKAAILLQKKGKEIPADIKQADQILNIPKSQGLYFADVNGDGEIDLLAKGSYGHIQIYLGEKKTLPTTKTESKSKRGAEMKNLLSVLIAIFASVLISGCWSSGSRLPVILSPNEIALVKERLKNDPYMIPFYTGKNFAGTPGSDLQ